MKEKHEVLLQKLEQSRITMEELLATVLLEREIYPGWTKKELVAHLTGWEEASLGSLQATFSGDPPSVPVAYRGPDYYNEQSVIERAELTYEQILREWQSTRQQVVEILRAMAPEQLMTTLIFPWGQEGRVIDEINSLLGHEQQHIHEIREIILNF